MKFSQGGQFEKSAPGSYIGRCIKVIDLGSQPGAFQGQTTFKRKVLIGFEMPTNLMTGIYKPELAGKPFGISQRFTQSLHKNSALKPTLESWRGRVFTEMEVKDFDASKLLGVAGILNLIESGEYINLGSITPVPAGTKCPPAVNPLIFLSLEKGEFDEASFNGLSEKLRNTISSSPEYKLLVGQPFSNHDEEGEEREF